jgi:anthranilate/para-aminobenzoate synthase component I
MVAEPQATHVMLRQGRASYLDNIQASMDCIAAGETYEVCLTNRLRLKVRADPLAVHRHLRAANPAPYACFMRVAPGLAVVGYGRRNAGGVWGKGTEDGMG